MAVVKVFTPAGEPQGEATLPEAAFGVVANEHVLWEAVRNHLANRRQGNAKVKHRGEVSGGGKKPWRQKGTGRARSGSSRSPVWVGGARAFGPIPRDYSYVLPRKIRRLALRSALSAKAGADQVRVVTDFRVAEAKTREVAQVLKRLEIHGSRCLLVVPEHDADLARAARNIPALQVREVRLLNPYEVLHADCLVIMQSAVPKIEEAWGS